MERSPLVVEIIASGKPGTRVLKLKGPLVLGNFFQFQSELRKEESAVTVLDMSEVPYMDSTGAGELVNYYVHCQRVGSRLVIAGSTPRVLDLFRVTHIETILPLAATVEEALQ